MKKPRSSTRTDEVIPGLYAVGNDAGGMYGDSYDMIAAGSACGFALVSGCLAGENALDYLRPSRVSAKIDAVSFTPSSVRPLKGRGGEGKMQLFS